MDKYFVKNRKSKYLFGADYYASSVLDIDYEHLYKSGIRCVAFDVDGTITKSASNYIDKNTAIKLNKLIKQANIKSTFLASNSERNLDNILNSLQGFSAVQPHNHNPKPSKAFYNQLITKTKFKPDQIAMVGDRYLQDIWGAKRVGLITVLVAMQPDHASKLDKLFLRNYWQQKSVNFWAKRQINNKVKL